MSDLIPLFGAQPHTTQQGQRLSGALAKQTRRDIEQVAAQAEVASLREQAHAFVTSIALTNASTLILQRRALMQVAPEGAEIYDSLVYGYTIGAQQRLIQGLR